MHRCHRLILRVEIGREETPGARPARTVESQPSIVRTGKSRCPPPASQGDSRRPPCAPQAAADGRVRCGRSSASRCRRSRRTAPLACAAVTTFDMDGNDSATELWLFPTGLAGKAGAKAAPPHRGRQGQRSRSGRPPATAIAFTAKRKDDEEPQIYLIAPDGGEARRLTSLATGCAAIKWLPTASGSRSSRGCGRISRPTRSRRSARRSARTPRSRRTSPSARSSASGTIGSPTAASRTSSSAMSRPAAAATRWPEPVSRCRRGSPGPSDFDIAPDGRELALTVDLGPEPRMMTQRDIVTRRSRHAAQARADGRNRHRRRAAALFAGRPRARVPLVRHEALVQRPGPPHAAASAARDACGRSRRGLDRQVQHVAWARDSRSLLCTIEDHGRVGSADARWRSPHRACAGRRRRHHRRLRAVARRLGARVRARERDASAGALRVPRRRQRRARDRDAQPGAARAPRAGRACAR